MTTATHYFSKMIQHLWQEEEVMLYGNLLEISDEDVQEVITFLKEQYRIEALDYPHQAPAFDEAAALWGAKTIYLAAQLLLYRNTEIEDLPALFPPLELTNPSAVLSVDLCLRFLPELIKELSVIDVEDPLIPLLVKLLETWHYSGINYELDVETLNFEKLKTDACLQQLYCDRVVHYKKLKLAQHPSVKPMILANLGDYVKEFWNELVA